MMRITLLVLICIFITTPAYSRNRDPSVLGVSQKVVRLGLEQDIPLAFIDKKGKPAGIMVEVLQEIARLENWRLEFVPGTFEQCLERLRNNEVDLVAPVAYSVPRSEIYDFNSTPVVSSWGQLYSSNKISIDNFFDLEGKRVAGEKGDSHSLALMALLNSFGVNVQFVPVGRSDEILAAVESGKADVGVIGRFSALQGEGKYKVKPTNLMFNPVMLHFAGTKQTSREVLTTIDRHLVLMKKDSSSLYYKSLDTWIGFISPRSGPLKWLKPVAVLSGIILSTFVITTLILSSRVKKRTTELEREIDVHKQVEESLLHSKEETMALLEANEHLKKSLSDVLDTLPSIIARVDRDVRVDLVNQRFEQFSGVSADNARGMLLESLIPHFTIQLQQVPEVIDRQIPANYANIQYRYGKDLYYYSLQIYPLHGEASGMAVIRIDDITEHVRIEEIMVQTEKMMMVGGLAAGMAHEINNPLGAIMQHAQNIERRVSPTIAANVKAAEEVGVSLELVQAYLEKRGILEFIGHIRRAGMRASDIIANMLHFSRFSDSGTESVDIAVLLDRVLELAGTEYDMKKKYDFSKIELLRRYSENLPPVSIIVAELEQVLLNILKNAAQAMVGSSMQIQPRITLRTRLSNNMVIIDIEDNGPGMDETTRLRIFEPFFSTKEVGVGTGLGLSVAYAIITKRHHGSIEVRSRPGEGSCFTIKLPLQGRA